jgi:diacylglycerol kinase (ATP)
MAIAVIVNPAAGGGRMGEQWPLFAAALERRFGAVNLRTTTRRGDASVFAHEFALEGTPIVVAAGGDGTVSEVADGLLAAGAGGAIPALAVVPGGTGTDFATCLGVPRQPEDSARAIAEAPARRIDAGCVSFFDDSGRPAVRHFVSIASLGVSGAIDRAVNDLPAGWRRGARGKAVFFVNTLRELMRHRFPEVSVAVDGQDAIVARIVLVAVANNPTFGGGMRIAPDARADDGQFEIVIARATSRLGMMRDLRMVYSGAHRDLDSCTFLSGRRVTVEARDPAVLLDIDGESPGRLPATFEMLEGALVLRGSLGSGV